MMGVPDSNSIRRQLQVSVTVAMAVLFVVGSLGVYHYVRFIEEKEFTESIERFLRESVGEVELEMSGVVDAGFHELALNRFAESNDTDDALYYVLRDHRGAVIFQSPWLKDESKLPFRPETRDGVIRFGRSNLSDGETVRTASTSWQLPVEDLDPGESPTAASDRARNHDPSAPENRVHMTVATSDESMRDMLLILAIALSTNGILITVVTAFLVIFLVGRACRPIEALSASCARIEPDRLSARLPESEVPNELAPLVAQFNSLLARVEQAFLRERRFSVDIAHELRTPVAELRSLAEVALVPAAEGGEEENPREIYLETAAIGERIGRLIDVLSKLHRSEQLSQAIDYREVNLGESLAEAVASLDCRSGGEVPGVRVECHTDARVSIDPALFRGILDNLLNNAVSYARSGSEVRCVVEESGSGGDSIVLEIRNSTDGLKSEDLHYVREPFWRKDAARSDSNHFGLGLCSVEAYARLLNIVVGIELDGDEFVVTLRIPKNS